MHMQLLRGRGLRWSSHCTWVSLLHARHRTLDEL